MTSEPLTTIKVPRSLRERIAEQARARRLTAAQILTELMDADDRRRRFASVRAAYETADDSYAQEAQMWESVDGGRPA